MNKEKTEPTKEPVQPPAIKITLDTGRNKLGEGRSSGIACGFLKQVSPGCFEGISPMSPCKDYLNDVVWSEATGKSGTNCGLVSKPRKCFDTHAYLVFASLTEMYNGGKPIPAEVKQLETNLANMQSLLNKLEALLKVESKTELVRMEENLIFAKIDLKWVSSTWAISLWSLLLRNALWATGGDPFDDLKLSKERGDEPYMANAIPKMKAWFDTGFPTQKWLDDYPHNRGIYSFPN